MVSMYKYNSKALVLLIDWQTFSQYNVSAHTVLYIGLTFYFLVLY